MKILLCLLALVLLATPAAVAQEDAAIDAVLYQSLLEPLGEAPAPGARVLVRLRGDALRMIGTQGLPCELHAGEEHVPAVLHRPDRMAEREPLELTVVGEEVADNGETQIVLDLGDRWEQLAEVELAFAAMELIATADIAFSSDRKSWTGAEKTLFVQRLIGSEMLRLSDVALGDNTKRYLRITLSPSAAAPLNYALGILIAPAVPSYELAASIGPMRDMDGGQVWPLILEADYAPLNKMKIVAENTEQCVMQIVRLDDDMQPAGVEANLLWLNDTARQGLTVSNKWAELPRTLQQRSYAISVIDAEDESVEVPVIRDVQAYAAEVLLEFSMPEEGSLRLLIGSELESPAVVSAVYPPAEALIVAGTFRSAEQVVTEPAAAQPESLPFWQRYLYAKHLRFWAFAAAALACLIVGWVLLAGRREN